MATREKTRRTCRDSDHPHPPALDGRSLVRKRRGDGMVVQRPDHFGQLAEMPSPSAVGRWRRITTALADGHSHSLSVPPITVAEAEVRQGDQLRLGRAADRAVFFVRLPEAGYVAPTHLHCGSCTMTSRSCSAAESISCPSGPVSLTRPG